MTYKDLELLRYVDEIILNAVPEELKRLQELDLATQLDGVSFCDVWACNKGLRLTPKKS